MQKHMDNDSCCRVSRCVLVETMSCRGALAEILAPFSLRSRRSTVTDADILCSDSTECFAFPGNVNCPVHISTRPVLFFTLQVFSELEEVRVQMQRPAPYLNAISAKSYCALNILYSFRFFFWSTREGPKQAL